MEVPGRERLWVERESGLPGQAGASFRVAEGGYGGVCGVQDGREQESGERQVGG